jgi:hypothetical protein
MRKRHAPHAPAVTVGITACADNNIFWHLSFEQGSMIYHREHGERRRIVPSLSVKSQATRLPLQPTLLIL